MSWTEAARKAAALKRKARVSVMTATTKRSKELSRVELASRIKSLRKELKASRGGSKATTRKQLQYDKHSAYSSTQAILRALKNG
jgi:hypothetical protein